MTKYFYLLLFFFSFSFNANAQIVYEYPKNQNPYQPKQLYKDIHEILMRDFKPCENKNELIFFKVLVDTKGKAEFLGNNTESKCANDLAKGVIIQMNKWIPAEIEGVKVNAFTQFIFFPDDLFQNYSEDYFPRKYYEEPQFPGGINAFRESFMKTVKVPNSKNDIMRFFVKFDVDKFGVINNINIETSENNTEKFQKKIKKAIEKIETKWIPAKYKGLDINSRFRMPVTIQFN